MGGRVQAAQSTPKKVIYRGLKTWNWNLVTTCDNYIKLRTTSTSKPWYYFKLHRLRILSTVCQHIYIYITWKTPFVCKFILSRHVMHILAIHKKEGCYAHVLLLKACPKILMLIMFLLILLTRRSTFLTISGACCLYDILPLRCGLTGGGNRATHSPRRMSFLSGELISQRIIETGLSHCPNPLMWYTPWGFLFGWICCKIWLVSWFSISGTGICNSCTALSLSLDPFCQRHLFGLMPWDFFFQNRWPVPLGLFKGVWHSPQFWLQDRVVDYPDSS